MSWRTGARSGRDADGPVLRQTFASLSNSNYRRFFVGQAISLVGTWMQATAQSWLVITITHSPTDLGVAVALQTLPVLLLGPYGGVVADRVDKRRLMVVLQAAMGVQALTLGVLVLAGSIRYWEILVLAVVLGLNNCFENPSRQAFVLEMVGSDHLRNAVSLNSTLTNGARAIGPALAGVLIATVGVGWCFVANAVSFVAVVGSLTTMDRGALRPSPPVARRRGQLREGFAYVARTPELLVPLVMIAVVGTLAYEFQVTLPVLAERTFHGGARAYGFITAAMGAGAVVGGLVTAARGGTGLRSLTIAAAIFGGAILLASLAPDIGAEIVALVLVGYGSVSFLARSNSTLQLEAAPAMRGRVMALWSVAFMGSTPVGGPLIGWVTDLGGARTGLGVGAASCECAALVGVAMIARAR
ncbi:MAG: MFS transporter, partial [Actinomycetota bacterium]|nr:MFS transporter [Actinomycetota bacterium]